MHTRQLIEMALAEDIGPADVTTETLIDGDAWGQGVIVAKQPLVLAGLAVAGRVFEQVDSRLQVKSDCHDGDELAIGAVAARVAGPMRGLLIAERTALNFLQRLSGIATLVRRFVKRTAGGTTRLVDTRKTTPGWRTLEKYAVRVGGAGNHRMGLFDGVLIKDNHIAACGGIGPAVARIRRQMPYLLKIEVEVTNMAEIDQALAAGADVIMLDNMTPADITSAVAHIDGRARVEVSGGVTLNSLAELLQTGVDFISVGAFTHSATAVDLSMRIMPAERP